MYTAFLSYMCVYVRICAQMLDIQTVIKNRQHFGKNRYIKLCQKFANPENLRTFAKVP